MDHEQKTILLVEDDTIAAKTTKRLLENWGYWVIIACNGQDAVDIFVEQQSINLVLMDTNLGGGIDGSESAKQILKKKHIPMVFHSVHAEQKYIDIIKKITRYGYVMKDSDDFVLRASIEIAFELFKTHEDLKKSEEYNRSIIESSSDSIAILDLQGHLVSMNLGGQKLHEIDDITPFLHKSWIDFWKGVHRENALEAISKAKQGNLGIFIGYCKTAKGTPKWWKVCICPMKDAHENIVQLLAISRDITDRKRLEDALSESETRYHLFTETTQSGILEIDMNGQLVSTNARLNRMLGYDGDEMRGCSLVEDLLLPEDRTAMQERLQARKRGQQEVYEQRLRKKNGETVWVLASHTLIRNTGNRINSSFVVVTDITNSKQEKQELLKTYRALEQKAKKRTVKLSNANELLTLEIKEHLNLESSLRENEARYQYITEGLTDYLYSVTVKNGIPIGTTHYQACEKVTGYTSKEFDENPFLWNDMIYIEDRGFVVETINHILDGGQIQTFEHRILGKDGTIRWVHSTLLPHVDKFGRLVSYDGMLKNITERKKAEEDIKEYAEQYKQMFSTNLFGFFLIDTSGRLTEINDAYCKMSGYYREELLKLSITDLDIAASNGGITRYTQMPILNGTDQFESKHKGKDGKVFDVEISLVYWNTRKEIIVLLKDITDRKKMENALRESEERFTQIADNIGEVFWIREIAQNKIIYISKAYEVIWGKSRENLYTHPDLWLETIHPDDREQTFQNDRNATGVKSEYRIKGYDGSYHLIRSRTFPIHNQLGEVYRIAGIASDITESAQAAEEIKKNQQQLLQADKMASLGMLVSGIAHEINNPNQYIISNLSFLGRAWKSVSPILESYHKDNGDFLMGGIPYSISSSEIDTVFSDILKGCHRIRNIIDELKSFSRRETYRMGENVDINNVINSALTLLEGTIKKSTYHFQIDYERSLPKICGNEQQLEQVIINVIQNACQSLSLMENGIHITTGLNETNDFVIVTIADEGCGISKELLVQIGTPFLTTKRDQGGTGLGLSISLKIIHEHKGVIMFAPNEPQGTIAKIYLPI